MSVESGLFAKLSADSDVTSVCGNRIYPIVYPQETPLPGLVYEVVDQPPHRNLGQPATRWVSRVRLSAHADSYAVASELLAAARGALDHKTGDWDGTTRVTGCWIEMGKQDGWDPETLTYEAACVLAIVHN